MRKTAIFCFLLLTYHARAQTCTAPGQTPPTAFPICGNSVFHQTTVPICTTQPAIFVPDCTGDGADYTDRNPFWYKFTCYQSGTLAFLISPLDLGDDYDWQLYDITGHDPNDVFTDHSIIVTGNWSGTYGNTGASPAGVSFLQCASYPPENKNAFSAMPNLIAGHTYLLLVSHYTNSQSGYDLSFFGGTAIITDTLRPAVKYVEAACTDVIKVKLNKKVKCSSIAANGSDFFILPGNISVVSAEGIGCSAAFDTDSIELHLTSALSRGTYSLNIVRGTDGNTILDYCDNAIPDSTTINLVLSKELTADFSGAPESCPNEPVQFAGGGQGQIVTYNWLFGDGGTSALPSPAHVFAIPLVTTDYKVSLTVTDRSNCQNSITKAIKIYSGCSLVVPSGFTPNGDGRNDTFHPLNALKSKDVVFRVYNRWGQLIFETNDSRHGWDGTFNGSPQPAGIYVWLLSYTENNSSKQAKGTVALIR